MLTNDSAAKPSLQFLSQLAEQADTASRQLVALSYLAISSNPKTVSVVSKLQFTHASRSSPSWLSKQPQLVQSFKLVVASLSCAELGTAQLQLVLFFPREGRGGAISLSFFNPSLSFLFSFYSQAISRLCVISFQFWILTSPIASLTFDRIL